MAGGEEVAELKTRKDLVALFQKFEGTSRDDIFKMAQDILLHPERFPRCSITFFNLKTQSRLHLLPKDLGLTNAAFLSIGCIDSIPMWLEVTACLNDPKTISRVVDDITIRGYTISNIHGFTPEDSDRIFPVDELENLLTLPSGGGLRY